ncbi:hypothetical protein U9688_15015, partial [Escherichia coli]
QNQPRRDDFGLKIGKLSHRTSIKDGLGRHIGSCGPLNRNFLSKLQIWRMRMHLKCPQCGSCNTLISSAGKLPSITDNKRSGYISLEFLPEILKEIIKAIKKLFGFLE